MKRIIVLALAACMVLGAAFGASAAEFKASGSMIINYDSLQQSEASDTNRFAERFRTQIDIISSENLSGTVYFEIGTLAFGQAGGGQLGTDGTNVKTRRMYLDFDLPMAPVHVRAGLQGLAMPSAVAGSPVFDNDVAAIVVSSSFDKVSVTGIFARPEDQDSVARDTTTTPVTQAQISSRQDMYSVIVSADLGVATVTPYFLYSNAYQQNNNPAADLPVTASPASADVDGYWIGAAATTAYAGFDIAVDAIYGSQSTEGTITQNGYFFAAEGAYALDMAKVALTGWYSSSHGDNNVMPSVGSAGEFGPTFFFGDTTQGVAAGGLFDTIGTRGLALTASEISFIEKLSHTVAVAYVVSDNALEAKVWEVDFANTYAMFENMDAFFEFGYANVNFDAAGRDSNDIYKFAGGVAYNF